MTKTEKVVWEKLLKRSRRNFWLSIVLVLLNMLMFAILYPHELDLEQSHGGSYFSLFVAGMCILGAFFHKKLEKKALIVLGRENEL